MRFGRNAAQVARIPAQNRRGILLLIAFLVINAAEPLRRSDSFGDVATFFENNEPLKLLTATLCLKAQNAIMAAFLVSLHTASSESASPAQLTSSAEQIPAAHSILRLLLCAASQLPAQAKHHSACHSSPWQRRAFLQPYKLVERCCARPRRY